MHDEVNSERDRFARASVREADVRGQDTVCQPRERLLGVVRVDRREASEMACVESLQQVKSFGPAHLAHEDPVGTMPQGRANKVRDRHCRHRVFLAKGRL